MSRLPQVYTLLADVLTPDDVFSALGSGFRGERARFDTSEQIQLVVVVALVAAAGWGLSRLLARQETLRRTNSPKALFTELCKAHGLPRADRRRLAELAAARGCKHPAEVFVNRGLFDVDDLPASLSRHAAQFGALAERLFVWPIDPDTESPAEPAAKSTQPSAPEAGAAEEYWLPTSTDSATAAVDAALSREA